MQVPPIIQVHKYGMAKNIHQTVIFGLWGV